MIAFAWMLPDDVRAVQRHFKGSHRPKAEPAKVYASQADAPLEIRSRLVKVQLRADGLSPGK